MQPVDLPGTDIVRITPDDEPVHPAAPAAPETPVTPDVPAAPDVPSLPPVQDSAAPGITILPASRTVPAAHALPQTGVNWLAAIGLAVSGFALTAAGAFVSLTGRHARH